MTTGMQLDRTLHAVLETFVERGYPPHYTELAARFGVGPEEGKKLVHDLAATGLPVWLYPGTDLIASCAPLQRPAHPVPSECRRPGRVVRAVRLRVPGRVLGVPGEGSPNRLSLPRLRRAPPRRGARRGHRAQGARGNRRLRRPPP